MSSPVDERRGIVWFLDAFLQERNIKWLLGLGVLILLGSSTMLVTTHWQSSPPLWKYAVVLAYTVLIHAAGQLAWHRLALRKTGTGLMALTVLLLPIDFLALRWVQPASSLLRMQLWEAGSWLALFVASVVFSILAARRIFHHFLRGDQPIFLASFLGLALSGALLNGLSPAVVGFAGALIWAVFTAGTWDVNRRVFWLTEEHRLPRICGFFPMLLLASQFLLLYAFVLAPHLPVSWCGLGLVLTAIPLLLSTMSLLREIQRRSEIPDLYWPVSVIAPLLAAVALIVAGICLAGSQFPQTTALVPAAALSAIIFSLLARKTGQPVFVWLTLLLGVTAYQTSPVFFKELSRQVISSAAEAIAEERLPLAFYGLTYFPLLVVTTCLAGWLKKRGDTLFSPALRVFSIAATMLLVAVSCTHAKAMLPVGAALCVMIVWQLVQFRRPWLQVAAIVSFIIAGLGLPTWLQLLWEIQLNSQQMEWLWLAASLVLLWPGRTLDHIAQRLAHRETPPRLWPPLCRWSSLGITLLVTASWLVNAAWIAPSGFNGGLCVAMLFLGNLSPRRVWIASLVWVVALLAIFLEALEFPIPASRSLEILAAGVALLAMWGCFANSPGTSLRRCYQFAAGEVGQAALWMMQLLFLGAHLVDQLNSASHFSPVAPLLLLGSSAVLLSRRPSRLLVTITWLHGLAFLGSEWLQWDLLSPATSWLPIVWATLCFATIWLISRHRSSTTVQGDSNVSTLNWCATITAAGITIAAIFWLGPLSRLAAVISLGALWLAACERRLVWRQSILLLGNLHVLCAALHALAPHSQYITDITRGEHTVAGPFLASLAAASALAWKLKKSDLFTTAVSALMQALALIGIWSWLGIPHSQLTLLQAVFAVLTFGLLAAVHTWAACQPASETLEADPRAMTLTAHEHASAAMLLCLSGWGVLVWQGFLPLHGTACLFGTLVAALVAEGLLLGVRKSSRFQAFRESLLFATWSLPAVTVLLALHRHQVLPHSTWLGINSLALLLAAGIYFWKGLERRLPAPLAASLVIANLAFALLWRELQFTDPQFYFIPAGLSVLVLVEILRGRIAESWHDPLRYAGALLILVSPTFHIVEGSWLHLFSLMVASVVVVLVAMGLRAKALMYTGTAFLLADLVAMVVRGSVDHPSLLWVAGVLLGMLVIGMAAWCERHRESVLQRLRFIAATLETWN